MFPIPFKQLLVASLAAVIVACSNGGGNESSSGSNGGGANTLPSVQLNDGDVLGGGGSSLIRIEASDDTGIVRVNNRILRQGNLQQCRDRFADNSLVANSLIEACVSDQASCAVTFQPINGQIEVIPPPLYAPIGIEYELSLIDRDASASDPLTAIFCFDVGINSPPVAAEDTYQISFPSKIERGGVRYGDRCEKLTGSNGVLVNDDDDEHITNTCLQAELVEGPRYASNRNSFASTFKSDGSFVYEAFESVPPENADGKSFDTFTYVVTDGVNPPSAPVSVEIVFTTDNNAPVTANDTYNIDEDSGIQTLSVLDNDSDPDALPLTIISIENGPGSGVASVRNGTVIEYRPNSQFVGADGFRYTVEDSGGLTASANVSINVNNVNDAPEAQNDTVSTNENTPVEISVLNNDSDLENNSLSVASTASPRNGRAVVTSNSIVTYTPNPNFFGRDSFEYTISDGTDTATATVVVNVISVNVSPSAGTDTLTVAEGGRVEFDLLANDSDGDTDPLTIVSVSDPGNGTADLIGDGVVRYIPNAGFNGTDRFSYVLSDGTVEVTGQVNVNVSSVNDAPIAADDTANTAENTSVSIAVLNNDTDGDGDDLTVVSVGSSASGSVAINSDNRSVTFTPAQSFSGSANFTYTIEDGNGGSDTASVRVSVSNVNADPVAGDDFISTEENDPVSIDVLNNDSDPDSDALTLAVLSQPANGSAAVRGTRIIYTPASDFSGTDSFTYSVSDPDGASDTATVTVTVSNVNANPVAQDDSASTSEDVAVLIPVTSNDSDPDGDSLSVQLGAGPSNGVASVQGTVILYTPSSGFSGSDQFSYTVSDPSGSTASATVRVTVSNTNASPVASGDTATTSENSAILIDVIDNDSDPDGDQLTVAISRAPVSGDAVVQGSEVQYTPNTGFSGEDDFAYTITDPSGAAASATVVVTVSSVNANPIAVDDTSTTELDDPVSIGILANDSDPDGDTISVSSVTQPASGTATISLQGSRIIYSPSSGFSGVDSFDYEVTDGNGGSSSATVTVTVTSSNAPPTAVDDVAQASAGLSVNFNILANDSDPDGDQLTVSIVTDPLNGSASVLSDNRITYTSDAAFSGSDSIVYSVDDGNGATDTATVDITVLAVNSAPVANDDTVTTLQDQVLVIDVLVNDTDPDGNTLIVDSVSDADNGIVVIANNTVSYTPDAGFSGDDSFSYSISDSNGGSDTATVSISVGAVNTAPNAADDTAVTLQDEVVSIDVLGNDTDADGDSLSLLITALPTSGVAGIEADNTITYTPDAGFFGVDSFGYTVSDGNGGSDPALVEVTVTQVQPVNNPPLAVADTAVTDQDTPVNIVVLANDSDPDLDVLSVTAISVAPVSGLVTVNADQSITYSPATGFTGSDIFEYTISDSAGDTAVANVEVTVLAVVADPLAVQNTAPVAADDRVSVIPGRNTRISVLDNDMDADGDALTLSLNQGLPPANGIARVSPNGRVIVYRSDSGFNGIDTFGYLIDDSNGGSDAASVILAVGDI